MGRLEYPQKRKIDGPWLLRHEDFEALNEVIANINEMLHSSWKNRIRDVVYKRHQGLSNDEIEKLIGEEENSRYDNKHEIICKLENKDATKLSDSSLVGILKDNSLKKSSPKELYIHISHGGYRENSFNLRISNLFSGYLEYEIECYDPSLKADIQYEIDRWIDQRKSSKLLRFWSMNGEYLALFLIMPIVLLLIIVFTHSYFSYSDELDRQAISIIKQGIDSTNRDQAIEILLIKQTGYVPSDYVPATKPKNPLFYRLLALSAFLFVASLVRPRTTIGLGNYKGKLGFYKLWIKFITVTVPTVIIIAPLWNVIINWIY